VVGLESNEGCFWQSVYVHSSRFETQGLGLLSTCVACLTINCAIPIHSCSNSGAGLLSGLIRVPQWLVAEAMAGRGLARSGEGPKEEDEI
jgi:hypothetical protein